MWRASRRFFPPLADPRESEERKTLLKTSIEEQKATCLARAKKKFSLSKRNYFPSIFFLFPLDLMSLRINSQIKNRPMSEIHILPALTLNSRPSLCASFDD